jgi:hypothetical protein
MSAKYPFYGKKGRPSNIERDICQKINNGIKNNEFTQAELNSLMDSEGIPMNQSELETLYISLSGEPAIENQENYSNTDDNQSSYEDDDSYQNDDVAEDYEDADTVSYEDDLVDKPPPTNHGKNSDAINFDPFKEPVIEREYTKGMDSVNSSNDERKVSFDDNDTSKPKLDSDSIHSGDDIPNVEFEEIEEDIPEPVFSNTRELIDDDDDSQLEEEEGGEKLGGDNLQDMSPAQKRKSAEKTAEAILQMYCKFAPLPFQKFASFSEKKITKMILNGQIDPNMQLENNVTVQEYIDSVNKQAEDVFVVTEETKEEIKDPLVEVLMEQELALTPTQRLLMAVGSHIVTMGFSAFQLSQNNKQALETFEKFHQQMRTEREPQRPTQKREPSVPFAQDFTEHDIHEVDDIIEHLNQDDDGIINPEHDPNVTVEETHDD